MLKRSRQVSTLQNEAFTVGDALMRPDDKSYLFAITYRTLHDISSLIHKSMAE